MARRTKVTKKTREMMSVDTVGMKCGYDRCHLHQQWGYQLIAPMRGSAFAPSESASYGLEESASYGLEGAVDAAINKILTELREQRIRLKAS